MTIMNRGMLTVLTVMSVVEATAARCSSSCFVQQDIISCRRFDRPSDVRACARRHPSASVLDLSYIDIGHPLTRRSLDGLRHIAVLYLDGSRIRRMDADSLTTMSGLQMVFARRMRGRLSPLLDAATAAPSLRQLALADNFVVCSCSWLRTVERLASDDVVIVDMLDAAPRCSDETIRRCHDDGRQKRMVRSHARMGHGRHRRSNRERHHRRRHRQPAVAAALPMSDTKKRDTDVNPNSEKPWIAHPGTITLLVLLILLIVLIIIFFATPLKYKLVRPKKENTSSKSGDEADTRRSSSIDGRTSGGSFSGRLSSTEPVSKSEDGNMLRRQSQRKSSSNIRSASEPALPTVPRSTIKHEQTVEGVTVAVEDDRSGPPSQRLSMAESEGASNETTPLVDVPRGSRTSNVNQSGGGTDEDEARQTGRTTGGIRARFASRLSTLRRKNLGKSNNSNNVTTSTSSSDDDDDLPSDSYTDD